MQVVVQITKISDDKYRATIHDGWWTVYSTTKDGAFRAVKNQFLNEVEKLGLLDDVAEQEYKQLTLF